MTYQQERDIQTLKFELLMVSKLAADKPLFMNPLNAAHAKKIRDRVLENPEYYLSGKEDRSKP